MTGGSGPGSGGSRRHRTRLVHTHKKVLDEVRSEINVTPLVDVCLVLLIIFMVVLPMLTRGKEVKMPETRHHTKRADDPKQPIVSVVRDTSGHAKIYFDRDLMRDTDQLKQRVQEGLKLMDADKKKIVFFKADRDLPYAEVYPVLIAVHESGSEKVELGTNDTKE